MAFYALAVLVKKLQADKEVLLMKADYVSAETRKDAEQQAVTAALESSPESKGFYGHAAVAKEIPQQRLRQEGMGWFKFDK